MKVMCKLSPRPLGIRGTVMKWVLCPHLEGSRSKVQKADIKKCEECRFFIEMKNTEFSKGLALNHVGNTKRIQSHTARIKGHIGRWPLNGKKVTHNSRELRVREEKKEVKTIHATEELKWEFEPLVDIFDEIDRVRVLAKIPSHHQPEDITLECGKNNGIGDFIIQAIGYEQHVPLKEELTAKLTGDIQLRSFKSGVINAELKKVSKKI